MGTRRAVTQNIIWNWIGTAAPLVAGFVIAPFLVHHLGQTGYGLWILIASVTAYFGFLDLGVRGSVGRQIAFHRARNDQEGVNSILSTALAILAGAALLALLGTLVALYLFFYRFDVFDLATLPAEEAASVRLALLIIGINLVLTFPANLFDATLWAFQRFDLLNGIDIPLVLLRTGLVFWLIGSGEGLVALALITLLTTAAGATAKAVLSFRTDPRLRVRLSSVKLAAARRIYAYGVWYFVLSVSPLVVSQITPLIIGARLAVQKVTPFSVATRLIGCGTSLLTAATGVLTPFMTTLHAQEKHDQQRQLFLTGGKYCLTLALFFLIWFTVLGRPFLILWMGPALASAAPLLTLLAVAEVLPMSQWATNSMILGMGRHRLLACASLVENTLAVSLALWWVGPYGLIGVCVALAIPGVLCRGVVQLLYGCRLAGVPLWQYGTRALLPAALTAALPALLLVLLASSVAPEGWFPVGACTAIYGIAYLACGGCLVARDWVQLRPGRPRRGAPSALPAPHFQRSGAGAATAEPGK
jgi:O-antigen/teichoic acid export membrane protein